MSKVPSDIYIGESIIILPDVDNNSIVYDKETRKISGGIFDRLRMELITAQAKIALLEKRLE